MLLVKAEVRPSAIEGAGNGLFLLEPVAKGTAVCRFVEGVDPLFTEEEICALSLDEQDYIRSHGRYSEAAKAWARDSDAFECVNHAEEPTLRGTGPLGEFTAACDLPIGAELTLYYPEICDMAKQTGLIDTSRTLGGVKLGKPCP